MQQGEFGRHGVGPGGAHGAGGAGGAQAAPALGEPAPQQPPPGQRRGQPRGVVGRARRGGGPRRLVQRPAQVVGLGVQAVQPRSLFGAVQTGRGAFGERAVVAQVAFAYGVEVRHVDQPLARVRGDRLEKPVAPAGRRVHDDHQRPVDQPRHQVEHVVVGDPVPRADRLGGRQVAAAAERGQPAQHDPLRRAEEFPTPVDHRAQRLLARGRPALTGGQDAEPFAEPIGQLPHAQRAHARGRQLQREREAVQAPADLLDGIPVAGIGGVGGARVDQEAGGADGGALPEESYGVGGRQRLDQEHGLAGAAQRFLAGGQHAQAGSGVQEEGHEFGGDVHDVFAVVQDEQGAAVAQGGGEAARRGGGAGAARRQRGIIPDADGGGDGLRQVVGGRDAQAGELDEPDAVGEPLGIARRLPPPRPRPAASCPRRPAQ